MTIGNELRLDVLERLKGIIGDLIDTECVVSDCEVNNVASAYREGECLKSDALGRIRKWTLCDRKRFEVRVAYLIEREKAEAESG